ncbi:hypothetical protein Y032_0124g1240 [Ancylostoma ceylanicum]|nr:hypothetical protein Y032_0124g1240 [Ancylostoma ceylanicum]
MLCRGLAATQSIDRNLSIDCKDPLIALQGKLRYLLMSIKCEQVPLSDRKSEKPSEVQQRSTTTTPWTSIYIAGGCGFVQVAQASIYLSSMWPYLRKLNPDASEAFFGYVVALYSFGQCISAPVFGYWSNRIDQVRLPLLVGYASMFVGNSLYLCMQFFKASQVGYVMMLSRFIIGSGTGNMALLRAYVSSASSIQHRSRAIACVSAGIATGTLIGPALQLLLTPLGPEGIILLPFFRLNMYNAPAVVSILLNVGGFMTILLIFEEKYLERKSSAGNKLDDIAEPSMIAASVCVATRFIQIFSQNTVETIGSAFSMLMFSFNKEESVAANASAHLAAGIVGAVLYFLYIFFDLSKLVPLRLSAVLSLCTFAALFLFTYPWNFLPNSVEIPYNGSDAGCAADRFTWCGQLPAVSQWVYYPLYVLVFGLAVSVMNISVITIFSEIFGSRKQGTHQGIFQMSGSIGRLVAPIVISTLYTKYGPSVPWTLEIFLISVVILLWIVFRKKMAPVREGEAAERVTTN